MDAQSQTGGDLPGGLADRRDELGQLQALVVNLRSKIPPQPALVNLHGVPGIGKTALLHELRRSSRAGGQLRTLSLDLDDLPAGESSEPALREIYVALQRQLGQPAEPTDVPDADAIVGGLTGQLYELSAEHPVLLLLDGCEGPGRRLVERLEPLLRRLASSGRALCVLASQEPLRFRDFDLRRRAQPIELAPFALADDTAQQLGLDAQSAARVVEVTQGYPLANEIARQLLAAGPLDRPRRAQLLGSFVDAIRSRIAVRPDDQLWLIVRVVALLREFDADTLFHLLPQIDPQFRDHNLDMAHRFVQDLVDTRLIRWREDSRARTLEPRLRPMFTEAVRLNEEPLFVRVHAAAADYYEGLISSAPRGRNQFLVEFYYHQLYKDPAQPYNAETLRSDLTQRLLRHYFSPSLTYVDSMSLDRLEELLVTDHELRQAQEERQIRPPDTLLDIVRAVRSDPDGAKSRLPAR